MQWEESVRMVWVGLSCFYPGLPMSYLLPPPLPGRAHPNLSSQAFSDSPFLCFSSSPVLLL